MCCRCRLTHVFRFLFLPHTITVVYLICGCPKADQCPCHFLAFESPQAWRWFAPILGEPAQHMSKISPQPQVEAMHPTAAQIVALIASLIAASDAWSLPDARSKLAFQLSGLKKPAAVLKKSNISPNRFDRALVHPKPLGSLRLRHAPRMVQYAGGNNLGKQQRDSLATPFAAVLDAIGMGDANDVAGIDDLLKRTPIPPHPRIVTGRLENGLEYSILPNSNPAGRFECHLEIFAGSADELESQQGMAHMC